MRSSTADLAGGAFALLFAAAFYVQSGELEGVGRHYPMGLIIFILLGGLCLLAQGMRTRLSGRDSPPANAEAAAYGRVGVIAAASVAYVLLISLLGFYTASVIFLFGSAMALNDAGWGWQKSATAACALTVIMCLAVWLGFAKLLLIPTPEGWLF